MKLKDFIFIVLAGLIILFTVSISLAQKTDYKPGEKIEYKPYSYQDVWEEGIFVEKSYDGSQPIIRFKPDQYFPQGEQKALADWNQIRPLQTKPQNNKADGKSTQKPAQNEKLIKEIDDQLTGEGLMSQADIINFLKTNLGANSSGNPNSDAIKSQLAEEIKRRGLNFHFETLSDFFNEMSKYVGVTTDISFPLKDNYGTPTKQAWLLGKWRLDKIGATTDFEKNGDIYRKESSSAANVGTLTINADETYLWQANAPNAIFKGKWRRATAEEMKSQGGDGIVLQKAKSDWDWIVMQNRGWKNQGDLIWISELKTRQVREIGSRGEK